MLGRIGVVIGGVTICALVSASGGCGKSNDEGAGNNEGKAAGAEGAATSGGDKGASAGAEVDVKGEIENKVGKRATMYDQPYEVEAVKISYEFQGMEEGTGTAWVADHGATVVMARKMTRPQPMEQITIWKDGKNTVIHVDGKSVLISGLRSKATELRLISSDDPRKLEMAGYDKKPNETIAGQDCEVWHHPQQNVTIWRWKGIDLKYVNQALKGTTMSAEATAVEVGAAIPDDVLTWPDDYEVKDMTQKRK